MILMHQQVQDDDIGLAFDISKNKMSLPTGFGNSESKDAIQSLTDFGKTGFGGLSSKR